MGGLALTACARRYTAGRRNEALCRVVALAADHQLPGDARRFVGERYGRQFCWLALDQFNQPGVCMAGSLLDLLDDGGGTDHENASQRLVSCSRDRAEPLLAGGGVIFRGEPDPSREVAPASEGMWIGHLHHL